MTDAPLRIDLPPGVRKAVEKLARESGVTPEQFLASAAAEKVAILSDPKRYLQERAARADLTWFDQFMARKTGEPPSQDDQIPDAQQG